MIIIFIFISGMDEPYYSHRYAERILRGSHVFIAFLIILFGVASLVMILVVESLSGYALPYYYWFNLVQVVTIITCLIFIFFNVSSFPICTGKTWLPWARWLASDMGVTAFAFMSTFAFMTLLIFDTVTLIFMSMSYLTHGVCASLVWCSSHLDLMGIWFFLKIGYMVLKFILVASLFTKTLVSIGKEKSLLFFHWNGE